MTVSDLLEQLVTGLIMPSSLLQLLPTCSKLVTTNQEQGVRTQLVNNLLTDLLHATCLQACNNLCVFTRVAQRTLTEEWREIFRVDIELYQHGS